MDPGRVHRPRLLEHGGAAGKLHARAGLQIVALLPNPRGARRAIGGTGEVSGAGPNSKMTSAEMHAATGLGPEWELVWVGPVTLLSLRHRCSHGLPNLTFGRAALVRLRFAPMLKRGLAVAVCKECKTAWIRTIEVSVP